MGILFLDNDNNRVVVHSIFYFYGDVATQELSLSIANDIANYWNEAEGKVVFKGVEWPVYFKIEGYFSPGLTQMNILENDDPRNNYFRIEDYSYYDHSFVDGLNSNTGYFVTADLNHTGSTAAHEYGHTLGLDHPKNMNIIGEGVPGIMYPRGSWVDTEFQYFPHAKPGEHGGTMNPIHRKVLAADIADLRLDKKLAQGNGYAMLGDFTSVWHDKQER